MRKLVITSFMSTGDAKPNLNETYVVLVKSGALYVCDYELQRGWFFQKKREVFVNRMSKLHFNVEEEVVAFVSIYELHNYMADAVEKFNKIYGNE